MLNVGLTGNMGSGKSTVCRVFHVLGIPIYSADDAAKNMYLQQDVLSRIAEIAGSGILDVNGQLDRRAFASLIFSQPHLLHEVTSLIHPLVRENFRAWTFAYSTAPFVIQEAAIIFESGFREEYDKIIHVSCPESLAIERIRKRDGYSTEEIRQRMVYQWSDEKKSSLADMVITNDGVTLITPQVLAIYNLLRK